MQQPLAWLRGLTFAPATNRRGEAGGAALHFVLRSQRRSSVVCLGSLSPTGLGRLSLLAERDTVALESEVGAPLFWLHMLVQAVREAPRLQPGRVQQGHHLELLELFAAHRHGAVLRRILKTEP